MPAHKVTGVDFDKLWQDSIDIASGPFKFQSWQRGTQMTLVKNPAFKAGQSAKLDRIVFRFIAGASEFQALQSGEADVMEPQPQVQIVDFYKNSKFKVQAGQGYQWEHLDFQQGAKAHPALKKKYVRHAIITGINRSQLREVLYVKTGLVTSNKLMPVLQSHIYKPFEAAYKPAYSRWKFSQRNAIALLKKNGCTGGPDAPSAGNSKIFSCPGVGQLSFAFTTTSGNPLRALTFEIIQRQLKSVGIEFTPRFINPAVLFGGGMLTGGDWQSVLFTFLGSPVSAATFFSIGGCGGDQNYGAACNRKASALLQRAQFTPDAAKRNSMLQKAETILAEEVFSIPLFARPTFVINNNKVKGTVRNPTNQSTTWNVEGWRVELASDNRPSRGGEWQARAPSAPAARQERVGFAARKAWENWAVSEAVNCANPQFTISNPLRRPFSQTETRLQGTRAHRASTLAGVASELAAIHVETPIGVLGVEATEAGVRRVRLPSEGRSDPGEGGSGEAAATATDAATQFQEYLHGDRESFDLALDWTDVEASHRHVLETLCEAAPFGVTVTYGELGRRAGVDDPRDVGVMMARNPLPLVVPCHRVVASDGLGGYGGGLELKRRLLELECVLPPRLDLGAA